MAESPDSYDDLRARQLRFDRVERSATSGQVMVLLATFRLGTGPSAACVDRIQEARAKKHRMTRASLRRRWRFFTSQFAETSLFEAILSITNVTESSWVLSQQSAKASHQSSTEPVQAPKSTSFLRSVRSDFCVVVFKFVKLIPLADREP